MLFKALNFLYLRNNNILNPLININLDKNDIFKNCFDCGCENPEFISINNGVFICKQCAINHMTFPKGISILVNNDKSTLTQNQLQFLKFGGNKKLYEYILNQCPSLINLPRNFLYTSNILNSYRKRLQDLVLTENESKIKILKNNFFNLKINSNNNNNNSIFNNSVYLNFNTYVDERFNTFNNDITEINNDNNILLNNMAKDKVIYNHKTLNYIELNKNKNINKSVILNKFIDNKNKKFKVLKKSNIIYNKPKLQSVFNKIKADKKDTDEEMKTIDHNNSEFIYNNYNNTIDNMSIHTINSKNIKAPSSMNSIKFKFSSKTIKQDKIIRVNKDRNLKNNTPNILKNKKNSIIKNNINYIHNNSSKIKSESSKTIKSERRIKEIIINKKMDNNYTFNSTHTHFNQRTLPDQRRPIQVNLSLLNTIDNSQYNNNYKIYNYTTDFNINETPTIIINNKSKNKRNIRQSNEEEINNKFIGRRNLSENAIKTININIIKDKNKIINNDKKYKLDDVSIFRTKTKSTIDESNFIKKDNVDQFQILSSNIFKKIKIKRNNNNTKIELDKNNNNNNEKQNNNNLNNYLTKVKRRLISPKKKHFNFRNNNEDNIIHINKKLIRKKILNNNSYKDISIFKKGEIFRNSIRNKYKKEKSIQDN